MWPFKKKEEDWETTWNARVTALEKYFGKSAEAVWHSSTPPIQFGHCGATDVLMFPNWVEGGEAYITAELTNQDMPQVKNSLGNYELMVCGKAPTRDNRFPAFIGHLAPCTLKMQLDAGHAMSIPDFWWDGSLPALLVPPLRGGLEREGAVRRFRSLREFHRRLFTCRTSGAGPTCFNKIHSHPRTGLS